jgi:hypothetical protein
VRGVPGSWYPYRDPDIAELCQEAQCRADAITRAYKKNDQAWIEQKDGAIVRKLVGRGRLEGAEATLVLADLHKVAGLYVSFFQPSFKLKSKTREDGKIVKKYHAPATPYEQLLADQRVESAVKQRPSRTVRLARPARILKSDSTGP